MALGLIGSLTVAGAVITTACVYYDQETGDVIPRGKQKYPFDEVKERAKELQVGMSKFNCLLALGEPAETQKSSDVWIYLPERKAYVVPGKFLKLEFENGVLKAFGYQPIVLGKEL